MIAARPSFTVDPWDPGYGTSVEAEMDASSAAVITDVEVADHEWQPIRPAGAIDPSDPVLFVDGVRRLDARSWLAAPDDTWIAGIFASFAAGCVRCDGAARVVDVEVGRGVYAPTNELLDVETAAGAFVARPTKDASAEALMYAVHDDMAIAEVRVAERARLAGGGLILLDGPLRTRAQIADAVGLVKSHQVRYLPPALDAVVARLADGERTPLFRVEAAPFARTSWYLRLPGASGSPWAGIVRCEASGALPTARLVELADRVSLTVPRFASAPHKDARAPQNLYPIAGLERELRRRLGDPAFVYRALRVAAASA